MTKEIKKLSLVFFTFIENDEKFILMGKAAPGKRWAGKRNGYGGKCEESESTLDCAIREIEEETREIDGGKGTGIKIEREQFKLVGKIIDEDKEVDVFVILSKDKFEPPRNNSEFVDIQWFNIKKSELFIHEMFPDNDIVIENLKYKIDELKDIGQVKEFFVVDETKNQNPDLRSLKRKIYSK